ncbi:hypothetical protein [Ruegeria atlantica]|uniref:hypothetical protein n=1 Tax=Ruegeria atlantica TaxID=81569 RepID=UPI00147C08AE|nr:hypothetical protein [Ruegeria atlantica]
MVVELLPGADGIIDRRINKRTRKPILIWHYPHPMLFGEAFFAKTSAVNPQRDYEREFEMLDNLNNEKTWSSEFSVRSGDGVPDKGSVFVEFQKNRIERIGDCKYKVWEVLVRERLSGSKESSMKVLYSPDLRLVLRRGGSLLNSGVVWDKPFDRIEAISREKG